MNIVKSGKGIPFQLRTFKEIIEKLNGEKIVFCGSKFVCFPFVELHSYAIRNLNKQYFIPNNEINNAVQLYKGDIGIEHKPIDNINNLYNCDMLVLFGGLAMKSSSGLGIGDINNLIEKINPKHIIGISYMGVFEKYNWINEIKFEYIIDGTISPINVYYRGSINDNIKG